MHLTLRRGAVEGCPKLETTQTPFNSTVGKHILVYWHSCALQNKGGERPAALHNSMNESHKNGVVRRTQTYKKTLCDSIYIKDNMGKNWSVSLEVRVGALLVARMGRNLRKTFGSCSSSVPLSGYWLHKCVHLVKSHSAVYFFYMHFSICVLFSNKNFKMCSWCFEK